MKGVKCWDLRLYHLKLGRIVQVFYVTVCLSCDVDDIKCFSVGYYGWLSVALSLARLLLFLTFVRCIMRAVVFAPQMIK